MHRYRTPHAQTLFHLIPQNQVARDALNHPNNESYVSTAANNSRLGLEVGFHVPPTPYGQVITRLGKATDLVLSQDTGEAPMSDIHAHFEMNNATHHVLLNVRSTYYHSVSFKEHRSADTSGEDTKSRYQLITGSGVILYGRQYDITIASYEFLLCWREKPELSKKLAVADLQESWAKTVRMSPRYPPDEASMSRARSWIATRLRTLKSLAVRDTDEDLRVLIGKGSFGNVYKTLEALSGDYVAVKVVDLCRYASPEFARARIQREVDIMKRLKHVSWFSLTYAFCSSNALSKLDLGPYHPIFW